MSQNLLHLPVSIGEALDKLSILDIKLDKILDSRREHILLEHNLLIPKLQTFIDSNAIYYDLLKKVNLYIWELMDLLRDGNENNDSYIKICKDTIIANDMRFRVKDKINYMSNSIIKEKKGYKTLRILLTFDENINLSESILSQLVLYFSIIYDQVYIKSSNYNIINFIRKNFNDENIFLHQYDDKFEVSISFNYELIIKPFLYVSELLQVLNIPSEHQQYFFSF